MPNVAFRFLFSDSNDFSYIFFFISLWEERETPDVKDWFLNIFLPYEDSERAIGFSDAKLRKTGLFSIP